MNEHELAIVDEVLPAIADTTLVGLAEQAEKRIEAMNKIKTMALKLTNAHDWVDEDGRPYLQASGAEKVGRLFGVSWRISEPTCEDLAGGHFMYTYTGEFSLAGATIDAVGTRSSKDGFFKKYKYTGNDERVELPASEIDRGDVKKAAYTNLLGNGITRLLGIRNLSYDDLAQVGIRREAISSVSFKKGGKPASKVPQGKAPERAPEPQTKPAEANGMVTEAQAKAIHAILAKMGIGDELGRMQKVAEILGLKEVPTSVGKLSKSQASTAIAALQKEQGGEG